VKQHGYDAGFCRRSRRATRPRRGTIWFSEKWLQEGAAKICLKRNLLVNVPHRRSMKSMSWGAPDRCDMHPRCRISPRELRRSLRRPRCPLTVVEPCGARREKIGRRKRRQGPRLQIFPPLLTRSFGTASFGLDPWEPVPSYGPTPRPASGPARSVMNPISVRKMAASDCTTPRPDGMARSVSRITGSSSRQPRNRLAADDGGLYGDRSEQAS
jgi:hypothetical protein